MAYLLDTNVISEVRKGDRCNWGVREFFNQTDDSELFLPVQVIGEIRAGIAKAARQKDHRKAEVYEQWLETLLQEYGNRIIQFDADCAQLWGILLSGEKKDPHTVDKQIAAIPRRWKRRPGTLRDLRQGTGSVPEVPAQSPETGAAPGDGAHRPFVLR
jgi:predicted nucleic acid-binding protein